MLVKNILFAKFNKQDKLQGYINELIFGEYYTELVNVKKAVYLTDYQWKKRIDSLLSNSEDYKHKGEYVGGRDYVGNCEEIKLVLENTCDYRDYMQKHDKLVKDFGTKYTDNIATNCVMVCNTDTDEKMFVNTEGYHYARYVGLEDDCFMKYAFKEITNE